MLVDYDYYSKEDFLADDYFIRSIKYPTEGSRKFWENWLHQCPPSLQAYLHAKRELSYILVATKRIEIKNEEAAHSWEQIIEKIPLAETTHRKHRQQIRWVAAASVLLCLFGLGYGGQWWYTHQTIAEQTPFSQIKTIYLPDSSKVILNVDSKITYAKNWNRNQIREVWLEGEGYFEVKHLNKNPEQIRNAEKFIVHTPSLDIQVLGTVFNVKERKNTKYVALISGSVAVKLKSLEQWHRLKPGEQFFMKSTNDKVPEAVQIGAIDTTTATAWRDRTIILKHMTTLSELIPQLEENYGVRIIVESSELNSKHLEGVVPLTNRENLFFILTNVLKADIQVRDDDTWIISRQNP